MKLFKVLEKVLLFRFAWHKSISLELRLHMGKRTANCPLWVTAFFQSGFPFGSFAPDGALESRVNVYFWLHPANWCDENWISHCNKVFFAEWFCWRCSGSFGGQGSGSIIKLSRPFVCVMRKNSKICLFLQLGVMVTSSYTVKWCFLVLLVAHPTNYYYILGLSVFLQNLKSVLLFLVFSAGGTNFLLAKLIL